jgi:serine/threonine kinase 32
MPSFKVFDYTRQRRSYYELAPGQTTSAHTGATSATAISSSTIDPGLAKVLTGGRSLPDRSARSATPSERTGVISKTGLDVEAQIADGGGMANLGGRGGWRSSEIGGDTDRLHPDSSVEMARTGSNGTSGNSPMRHPTPLRSTSG